MDNISSFFADISSIEWTFPLSIKLVFIFSIIIILCVAYYLFGDNIIIQSWGKSVKWLFIIVIINLLNIAGVMIYNNNKIIPQGRHGIRGKSGKKGNQGKFLTCSYCKTNLYIETVRKYDTIVNLNIHSNPVTQNYTNSINNMNQLLSNTDNLDYASIINSFIFDLSVNTDTNTNKFISLLNPEALQILAINHLSSIIGKALGNNLGQINRPFGKVAFLPLGDGLIGAGEIDVELNYFMCNGDIVYPSTFTKLVQFPVSVNDEGVYDIVSIWHPEPVIISENGKEVAYYACGDISNYSSDIPPTTNSIALISENCLQYIDDDKMELMFLYSGISRLTTNKKTFILNNENNMDDNSDGMFKIISNSIDVNTIFSVWRTPFNTMITNIPSPIVNNTFAYNILNSREIHLDDNGFVSLEGKQYITNRLSSIVSSNLLSAAFIIDHFIGMYTSELDYYINKNLVTNTTLKNEYKKNMRLANLMLVVKNAKSLVDNYVGKDGITKSKPPQEVPVEVIRTYSKIQKEATFIPYKIQDVYTMLDLVSELFPSGIDTLIAIDEEGDVEGGINLSESQKVFINVCKLLFLPDIPIYEIKDECVGTYQRDNNKDDAIRKLNEVIIEYNRKMDKYKSNPEDICNNWEAVQKYSMQIFTRIGEYVGHIPDYQKKIENMNLDEFTVNKINKISDLYHSLINYIDGKCI